MSRRRQPVSPLRALHNWFRHHLQALLGSLRRHIASPLPAIMSGAVIGIALALPATLFTLLDNVRSLSAGWEQGSEITLFLTTGTDLDTATDLAGELRGDRAIAEVRLIDPDLAMAEFRTLSGFGAALDLLDTNPLPVVLIISPAPMVNQPGALASLAARLQELTRVDIAQLDLEWVQRLRAILDMVNRGVLILGALLGLTVLLVVGNTIRLDIENRREEIIVTKLVGGTDAFVRRPFLYSGIWLGTSGGILAWLLVELSLALVKPSISHLAGLYASTFRLVGPGLDGLADLILAGVILGYLGAWLAVGHQLRRIEPS